MPSNQPTSYITTLTELEALCRRLSDSARIALDTEFMGEERFVPQLEVIQVATDREAAVIDFQALQAAGPLDCLWEAITRPGVEKVLHAGRQDLELFSTYIGQIPTPFFDTQIAAAMVGYGTQIAYANLVQRVSGARLEKAHTFTNWSQRPLSDAQLTYAIEDVTYLLPAHEHLYERLTRLDRLGWVREEFERLAASLGNGTREPRERFQRIRGWDTLKPRAAAILRELVAWREGEARRRNLPRGRVIRDEVLVQMARHPPKTLDDLRGVRGLHSAEVTRHGSGLLELIQRAMALPSSEWPTIPSERRLEPESAGVIELLQAVVKARAAEEHIAPTLVATAADLQALIQPGVDGDQSEIPVLRGWRRKLVGDTLLELVKGKLHVHVNPKTGRLLIRPTS